MVLLGGRSSSAPPSLAVCTSGAVRSFLDPAVQVKLLDLNPRLMLGSISRTRMPYLVFACVRPMQASLEHRFLSRALGETLL